MARTSFLKDVKFKFDKRLKEGFYSSDYFLKTREIIANYKPDQVVTMQFIHFCNQPMMVCGASEVKALLEFCLTEEQLERLEVYAVEDGTILEDSTYPMMIIKGKYSDFGYLENIIDGILSRRSSVATNCMTALDKIESDQRIIYMADRSDDYNNQAADGYAAYVAGIDLFVTQGLVEHIKKLPGVKVIGTIPHALIQQYKGNLSQVVLDYNAVFNTKPTILIDYHNDVITELENVLPVLDKVSAIRIDTAKNLIDKGLERNNIKEYGVSPKLVKIARQWLDKNNFSNIQIIVSSGVTPTKIEFLNQQNCKINTFGIGNYFLGSSVLVTADLVQLDGEDESKVGRHLLDDRGLFVKII